MKKHLTLVAAAATALALFLPLIYLSPDPAQAGIFDSVMTKDWPTKDSIKFKVDAYGFDIRVYEWVTESDPNTVCTVAIGNSDSSPYMGMQCFKKSLTKN